MNAICFFSSYFNGGEIPYSVKYYLEELSNYFDEILFLTNRKELVSSELDYLHQHKIKLKLVENEGMDFGMWRKAFLELGPDNYERIGLVNDSCIIFKSLKPLFLKAEQSDVDAFGMVYTGKYFPHLQSYFILLNKKAIAPAREFICIKREELKYKEIIFQYEIGLSRFLLEHGLKLDGFFDYSQNRLENPAYILAEELIRRGSPMIKKKLLSRNFRTADYLGWMRSKIDIDHRKYLQCIEEANNDETLIDLKKVITELGSDNSHVDIYTYRMTRFIYNFLRKISFLRFLFHQLIKLKRMVQKTSPEANQLK